MVSLVVQNMCNALSWVEKLPPFGYRFLLFFATNAHIPNYHERLRQIISALCQILFRPLLYDYSGIIFLRTSHTHLTLLGDCV